METLVEHDSIPRDSRGRKMWLALSESERIAEIESRARMFVENGGSLSQRNLVNAGQGDLRAAISLHFPGRMTGLRERLGLSRNITSWRKLKQNGTLNEVVEQEAVKLINLGNNLTPSSLKSAGQSSLNSAILRHYPGGILELRKKLGLLNPKNPRWTIEAMEQAAREFVVKEGGLTGGMLEKNNLSGLKSAISERYPGGLVGLRQKIGIPESQKPKGYWVNNQMIEEKVQELAQIHGGNVLKLLPKINGGLYRAIRQYYPGGMAQIASKLNLEPWKGSAFWTPEQTESEAKRFLTDHDRLTPALLKKQGRGDLLGAIHRYGGFQVLCQKLELPANSISNRSRPRTLSESRKPPKYWTIERIEEEAIAVVKIGSNLTNSDLLKKGLGGLAHAITTLYPGGVVALRKKIDNPALPKPKEYWANESNIENELLEMQKTLEHFPSYTELSKNSPLLIAVAKTGGLNAWRARLGIKFIKSPNGYWDNEENIRKEVERVIRQNNLKDFPTKAQLAALGEGSLLSALSGKFPSWRRKTGYPQIVRDKTYWTNPENIITEANNFLSISKLENLPHSGALSRLGYSSLAHAIYRHYPGGITKLREDLKLPNPNEKPRGHWTNEAIEKEMTRLIQEHGLEGVPGNEWFKTNNRVGLLSTIYQKYPQGREGLAKALGVKLIEAQKGKGYWRQERIEDESMQFLTIHGELTTIALRTYGRADLLAAINRYAGGVKALRWRLGITSNGGHEFMSSQRAQEDLWKLLDIPKTAAT